MGDLKDFKGKLIKEYNTEVNRDTSPFKYLQERYSKLIGRMCILRDCEAGRAVVKNTHPKPAKICGVTNHLVILEYKTYNPYGVVSVVTETVSFASIHCGSVSLELLL